MTIPVQAYWAVSVLYLALLAGLYWQGFLKGKKDLAMSIWDVATILYAVLVACVLLMSFGLVILVLPLLFVALPATMIMGVSIPWFFVSGSAFQGGEMGLQGAFSGIVVLGLIGAVCVVFSYRALKKVKDDRRWSAAFFVLGGLGLVSAISNFFTGCSNGCGTQGDMGIVATSLLFNLLLLLAATVIYRLSPNPSPSPEKKS